MRLQKADTIAEYEMALSQIAKQFPTPRKIHDGNGTMVEQTVADYLRKIHPTSWTNLGNYDLNDVEGNFLRHGWSNAKAFGSPTRLFGVRTTSATEGENHALIWSDTRVSEVLMAFVTFCERAFKTVSSRQKLAEDWAIVGANVTPKAKAIFDKEVARSTGCSVRDSPQSVFYVDDCIRQQKVNASLQIDGNLLPSKVARTHRVDVEKHSCTRCITREHMGAPCRHLLAALKKRNKKSAIKVAAVTLFADCYKVETYRRAFQDVIIDLPLANDLKAVENISPPPMYKQPGVSNRKKPGRDRAKMPKRFPSRGELLNQHRTRSGEAHQGQDLAREQEDSDDDFILELSQQIVGATTKKRRKYQCSGCGKAEGHNIATCPSRGVEKAEAGSEIVPGIYLVGNCPFEALRRMLNECTFSC
jgi:hypothetical protein